MRSRVAIFLLIAAIAALGAMLLIRRNAVSETAGTQTQTQKANGKTMPVLVELFTSEGCSSCPPADDVLARLEETQPVAGAEIIALGQHVDYWNRLGWADPYSSAEFSARQNEYAGASGRSDVYTPQMVVDGRVEFVGSNEARAREAIASAIDNPKANIAVNVSQDSASAPSGAMRLAVRIDGIPSLSDGDAAEVLLAITESGLRSDVLRGENAGRKLTHAAVVRKLAVIGSIESNKKEFSAEPLALIEKEWKRKNIKAVVFVQERASRRILGAAALRLDSE